MKTNSKVLVSLLFLIAMVFCSNAYAKVKLKIATQSTATPYSGGQKAASTYIDCEGYDVLVREVNGETVVYVDENEDGEFTDEDIVPVPEGKEWSQFTFFIGGEHCQQGDSTKFTMTGGEIGDIAPMSPYSHERAITYGNITVKVTGGTVGGFNFNDGMSDYLQKYGPSASVNIMLKDVVFNERKARLFMATTNGEIPGALEDEDATEYFYMFSNIQIFLINCTYEDEESLLDEFDFMQEQYDLNYNSGIIYTSESGSNHIAFGKVAIPLGFDFEVYKITCASGRSFVTNNANVKINKCNGFVGFSDNNWFGKPVEMGSHMYRPGRVSGANCTDVGTQIDRCVICNHTNIVEVPALGHLEVIDPAVPATCTTAGTTEGKYCARCGEIIEPQQPVLPTHKWVDYIAMPGTVPVHSCEGESGLRVCSECGVLEVKEDIHNFDSYETLSEPTCTTFGLMVAHCSNNTNYGPCSAQKFEIISTRGMAAHTLNAPVPMKDSSCSEEGYESYKQCSVCNKYFDLQGRHIEAPIAIPTKDHTFESTYVDISTLAKLATCTELKEYFYSCSVCHALDTQTFTVGSPLGHTYEIKSIDYINPDEPESGSLTLHCTRCDAEKHKFSFAHSLTRRTSKGTAFTSKLTSVLRKPTCIAGRGVYTLNVKIGDSDMTTTYEAPIKPVFALDADGYAIPGEFLIHDWDEDGCCANHTELPRVAGFIRRPVTVTLDDESEYTYDTGESYATLEELFASPNASKVLEESKVFADYNLADGVAFTNPIANGFSTTKFKYNRAVTGGRIVTFALPANVPTSKINGSVYRFQGFDEVAGKFDFKEVTDERISADTPYLAVLNDDAVSLYENNSEEILVKSESEPCITVGNACHLGAYASTSIASAAGKTWYGYDSSSKTFVQANTGTILPFRTAFSVTSASAAKPRISLGLIDDDGETSIVTVDADKLCNEGSEIYDLSGKKVSLTQPGHIYIINGKKQLK